ncbi:MAG: PAS domain S-box protein [Promethearchaeota archaeon]
MTEDPSKTDDSDTKRYRQAEEALRESEARYRSLFENSPTSLWEEDFSAVKTRIDYLKSSGINDFRIYFNIHPEEVSKCASLVKILDINKATIELLEAKNKDEVFGGLTKIFTKESLEIFKEELIALIEGKSSFESEAPHLTLKGNVKKVIVKLTLIPEYAKTWSKLFISITDITKRKEIEKKYIENAKKLEVFNNIMIATNEVKSLPSLVKQILDLTLDLMDFEGGGVYLLNEKTRMAELIYHNGLPADLIEDVKYVKIDEAPYNLIFIKKEPIFSDNYRILDPERSEKWGILSVASIPLVSKNKVIGALNIASKSRFIFSEEEKDLLSSIGREFGTAIMNIQTENALKQSQTNLETLFNSINEYIFVIDLEGHILRINRKVIDNMGYSEEDIRNMHILDLYPPERHKEAIKILADMITGKIDSCNIPIQTRNSKLIPVESKFSKGFWGNQEVLFGISRDITERIKVEEIIRESEEKFRTIAEQSLMGVAIIQDDVVKYINQQHADLLGYSVEEILNWQPGEFFKVIHPDDKKMILEQAQKRTDESETGIRNYIARGVHRSGRIIWLEVWFKTIKYQNRNAFLTTYIDITEKRKAEKSLRESEEKYRYLFENAPSSIILIDTNGNIRDVNPRTLELTGYKKEELIGRNYLELRDLGEPIAEKYIPRLVKRFDRLVQGQRLPPVELKIKTKDSNFLWFNFQTNVIKIGEELFLQTIGHDITEERKIQDNLIKASNKANFYKDLFAHDMKNILTAISGSAELYSLYKDKSDKLKQVDSLFDIVREQTDRGALLISNVQKLSKIEESEISIEDIDINEILNDGIEFILNSYKNREIKVNIAAKEAKYYAQANELLLDVFENILINSVKHNDNPTVEIQIKISKEKKKEKKYLKIEFIDNGRGIPDARKETIFQRVSNQQRSISGMGLGLSLVKFIIDSYHGDILVEDRIRGNYTKGSNFIILIPEAE